METAGRRGLSDSRPRLFERSPKTLPGSSPPILQFLKFKDFHFCRRKRRFGYGRTTILVSTRVGTRHIVSGVNNQRPLTEKTPSFIVRYSTIFGNIGIIFSVVPFALIIRKKRDRNRRVNRVVRPRCSLRRVARLFSNRPRISPFSEKLVVTRVFPDFLSTPAEKTEKISKKAKNWLEKETT